MAERSICVIGLGNMGQALVKGLLETAKTQTIPSIEVFDVHTERMRDVVAMGRVKAVTDLNTKQFTQEVVILCVKPQDLKKVGAVLKGKLSPQNVVISILAGTQMQTVSRELGFDGPMMRSMSNMPAVIRLAATVLCANQQCVAEHREIAELVFGAVGDVYWTTHEEHLDTVTGLSGSGPAYVYMVIEALTDGGVKMGLPRDLAAKLSIQTVLGAASLVKSSGLHPAILRDQVATPAGTTISALHELESHGLRSMFVTAVVAATERAREIGKVLNHDNIKK